MITLGQVKKVFPHHSDERAEAFLAAAQTVRMTECELLLLGGQSIALKDASRLVLEGNGTGYWCSAIYNKEGRRTHLSQGHVMAFEAAQYSLKVNAALLLDAQKSTEWAERVVANEDYLPWSDVAEAKEILGIPVDGLTESEKSAYAKITSKPTQKLPTN